MVFMASSPPGKESRCLLIFDNVLCRVKSQAEQVSHCLRNVERYSNDLDKYIYLMDLLERNERLFYRLLSENTELLMPLVYTPTVGEACQKFGYIFRRPQGLFISIKDKGHVYEVRRSIAIEEQP